MGGIFIFYSNFKIYFCKQTVENLIRRLAASGLVLRCLPMSLGLYGLSLLLTIWRDSALSTDKDKLVQKSKVNGIFY